MRWLAFITAVILGLIFAYKGIGWLGLLFFILAVLIIFVSPAKSFGKKAWEEAKSAGGESPEALFKGYVEEAGRFSGEAIFSGPNKRYSTKGLNERLGQASKNAIEELQKL